jgi:putative RecB family exonuclease
MQESELKPPPHLSVSSIQTFQQCPLKFKFNKIDLIQDAPGEAAILGNFVHDVLELMYKQDKESRTQNLAKFYARQLWDEVWSHNVKPLNLTDEQIRRFRWSAWWCIENLWKIENPQEISPIAMEHEVNVEIGGVKIKGFIDRFSQSEDSLMLTVTDYKTGKTPRKEFQDDKFFQLNVYAKALSLSGIGEVDHAELLYLKDGVRLKRDITDKGINETVETIQRVKSEIDESCNTGNFPAVTSVLCGWCSYKPICPKWNKK